MSKNWIKESTSFKLLIVGIMVFVLLIPVQMVKNLIHEREYSRNEVVNEIGSKWAGSQTIGGPIITVPYRISFTENDKIKTQIRFAHFLPERLTISGNLSPEVRYRGIYKAIVYASDLNLNGSFSGINFDKWDIADEDILWNEAYLSVGIPDMRGINETVSLEFDEQQYQVDPGIRSSDIISKGISSNIIIMPNKKSYDFKLHLALKGSETIQFIPVGKTTKVEIKSTWDSPSFSGSFLPANRSITANGFNANWLILHLNRNYPQQWLGANYDITESAFGVNLLLPVNQYLKSERAIKYAIMFIALTFLVFFFTEILSKKQIHPIQYLMVGISLVIFYTLLISLSEHISFDLAYLIASVSVITLITLYTKAVIKDRKPILAIASVLIALYVFLYTILQLEAYSLLMGSVGLFIVLSLIMYLSRKIDWNTPLKFERKEEE